MPKAGRTPGRQKILSFIISYWGARHISPTVREISEGTVIRSTSTIHGHLQRMTRDGLICMDPRKPRSICPLVNADGTLQNPVLPQPNLILMEIDRPLAEDCASGVLVIRNTSGAVTEIYETDHIRRCAAG